MMNLCPLLANDVQGDGDDEEGVKASRSRARVHPVRLDTTVGDKMTAFDVERVGAKLARVHSDLVTPNELMEMPLEVVQALPAWAQRVVSTGCFRKASLTQARARTQLESTTTAASPTEVLSPSRAKRRVRTASLEGTPSKRQRRRSRGDCLDVETPREFADGDSSDDDVSPQSENLQRTLFTPQDRVAESVDKYSDAFEVVVASAQERLQDGTMLEEGADVLTESEVKSLVQSLKVMEKHRLIEKCDPNVLISLMTVLDRQVQIGQSLSILSLEGIESNEMNFRIVERLKMSVDAAICELVVMSTPEIDRQVLSEERIDEAIQFLVHTLQNNLLRCLDPTLATTQLGLAKIQRTRTRTSSDSTASRSTRALPINIKSKPVRKAMDRLVPVVSEFMQQFAKLLLAVSLADRWILQFSSKVSSLFLLERSGYASLLQRSSILVLRAIFLKYPPHRTLVLDEVLSVFLKLPAAKRQLRTVKLTGSNNHVQVVTTLVVALIQSCAGEFSSRASEGENVDSVPSNAKDGSNVIQVEGLANRAVSEAQDASKYFIGQLLKECMKKTEERDNRVILENFTEDLLTMLVRPEWAGTECLLEVLSSSLAAVLHSNLSKDSRKLESQISLLAVQLVGRICVAIKATENDLQYNTFEDDTARSILQEHECFLQDAMGEEIRFADQTLANRIMVLKHVVITYMRQHKGEATQIDSTRMLLSRYIAVKEGNRDELNQGLGVWSTYWNPSPGRVDLSSKLAFPSHDICLRASLHVACSGSFCGQFNQLLVHLMALLPRGIVAFRSRVMKALSAIIDVDPTLMSQENVQKAVSFCFLDEAISVRQAAVELVGKYIAMQPKLFDQYFDSLADRLRDKGISVRKSVCKIFREFLISQTSANKQLVTNTKQCDRLQRRAQCMRNLVERIGDVTEDETVKSFIIDTFQDAWFDTEYENQRNIYSDDDNDELPPGWKPAESNPLSDEDTKPHNVNYGFKSPDGKIVRSTNEAWAVFRAPQVTPVSVAKRKRTKVDNVNETVTTILEVLHDAPNTAWFVSLLRKNMGNGDSRNDEDSDITSVRGRSKRIVDFLVEAILRLEEGKYIEGVSFDDAESQYLACVKALEAFSQTEALLVAPHLSVLMVYLKGDDKLDKTLVAKLQSLVISIVGNVIVRTERLADRVASTLEEDLQMLVCRAPPSVVGPSVKCLAIIATHTQRPPTLLFKLLELFYTHLLKYKNLTTLKDMSPAQSAALQRALYVPGLIAGSIDLELSKAPEGSTIVQGEIMNDLYNTYSAFLSLDGSPACLAKTMQGLGFLYHTRPRFLLQTQTDGFLDKLLASSSTEVKLQCVSSLRGLLEHEEHRLEAGEAVRRMNNRKTKQEQVQGDQEGEASVIGGVMQAQLQHLLDLTQMNPTRLRNEALECIAVLLTQGLVSPLPCIPVLVALETDQVVSIRDIAHAQLVALHAKFPTTLQTPSVDGVALSYAFQLKLFDKCSIFALDKDKKNFCLLGRLYSSCLRSPRTQRNFWLTALTNHFTGKGNVLSVTNLQAQPLKTLDYLSYLSQLLTALPFDIEDEPLFTIYLINRFVTLKLGPALQELRHEFAEMGIEPEVLEDEDADLSAIDIDDYTDVEYDYDQMKDQLRKCCRACAIGLLIRVKFFLKDLYVLDNEKCQTYRPDCLTETSNQPVMVADRTPRLELPSMQFAHPLALNWNLFQYVSRAACEDQEQLDFENQGDTKISRKRRARRKKPVAARRRVVELEEDDEEINQDEDVDVDLSDDEMDE